jgi:enoyl-CoA hydratase
MTARLLVSPTGPIATIAFSNLARHNAVTYDMWSELPARLAELDADSSVRAVVLTGDGEKAFVAGAEYTNALARNSPLSMRAANEAMRIAQSGASPDAVARARGMVEACFTSEDYQEGRRVFAQKRVPSSFV